MPSHRVVALVTLALLIIGLPWDVDALRFGVTEQPQLAVGISLKILMHLGAIVGLWKDITLGYAFLLGASAQALLIDYGSLTAVPPHQWSQFVSTLWWPVVDGILRMGCLVYLATRPGRIIGWEATQ